MGVNVSTPRHPRPPHAAGLPPADLLFTFGASNGAKGFAHCSPCHLDTAQLLSCQVLGGEKKHNFLIMSRLGS